MRCSGRRAAEGPGQQSERQLAHARQLARVGDLDRLTADQQSLATPEPICRQPCPGGSCPIAWALGGGIDSWGSLTLVHTTVSNNAAGAAAGLPGIPSDADGGGILSAQGSLTMTDTTVSGNRAIAAAPDGQFAEGGAVFVRFFFTASDSLTVSNSTVTGNSV